MDSILGALALGDIGLHFPDTEEKYRGVSSLILLEEVVAKMKKKGYQIVNLDATLVLQRPKVRPYIDRMRENMAKYLDMTLEQVNVKATTEEKLGFTGREEGVKAYAVVLLEEV